MLTHPLPGKRQAWQKREVSPLPHAYPNSSALRSVCLPGGTTEFTPQNFICSEGSERFFLLRKISVKSENMQQFTFGELNLRQKKKTHIQLSRDVCMDMLRRRPLFTAQAERPEERSTKIHTSELNNPDTFSGDISKEAILIFQFKE